MDLELSDDQVSLRDGIQALLAGRFDMERVRTGFDRAMYDELAEAGVFSLISDGFVWADAAIVFEQLGEFCVPGPLVTCAITGECASHVETSTVAIEHVSTVDYVYQIADTVTRAPASSFSGVASDWPLDPLTPILKVGSGVFGESVGDAELAQAFRRRGTVLTAAFQLGMAQRLTTMTVDYAKSRVQFDRPIGSFQAIKHLLADMVVRNEVARAAVYAAAAHLDEPDESGLDRTIAVAKVLAGEAAVVNGKTATQVHGGMGYTWEVDVHLYLKRAWLLETHFGSAESRCDDLAAILSA